MDTNSPVNWASWTQEDVGTWLTQSLNLPQYKEAFASKGIDGPTLTQLAETDLEEALMIDHIIHRKKILGHIKCMRKTYPAAMQKAKKEEFQTTCSTPTTMSVLSESVKLVCNGQEIISLQEKCSDCLAGENGCNSPYAPAPALVLASLPLQPIGSAPCAISKEVTTTAAYVGKTSPRLLAHTVSSRKKQSVDAPAADPLKQTHPRMSKHSFELMQRWRERQLSTSSVRCVSADSFDCSSMNNPAQSFSEFPWKRSVSKDSAATCSTRLSSSGALSHGSGSADCSPLSTHREIPAAMGRARRMPLPLKSQSAKDLMADKHFHRNPKKTVFSTARRGFYHPGMLRIHEEGGELYNPMHSTDFACPFRQIITSGAMNKSKRLSDAWLREAQFGPQPGLAVVRPPQHGEFC